MEQTQQQTKQVSSGVNTFAANLYKSLSDQSGENLFFSPFNIATALAMVIPGAKENTLTQLKSLLNLSNSSDDEIHASFQQFNNTLNSNQNVQLSQASKLWPHQGFQMKPEFIELLKKFYASELDLLNFENEQEARTAINTWVEKQTNEKIKDLIPQGLLNDLTRFVLTTAIYFKGDWKNQFQADKTTREVFYIEAKKGQILSTMVQSAFFKVAQHSTFSTVELPYKGESVSMIIALPNEGVGIDGFWKTISDQHNGNLTAVEEGLKMMDIELQLPKFKFDQSISLAKQLKALGLNEAFDQGKADFSGMTGKKDIFLQEVIHKAFVEVNEKGTEAAAATGMCFSLNCMPMPKPIVRINRPFVFYIKDNTHNNILFLGRFNKDPEAEIKNL